MSSQVTNATSARSAPVIREHRIPTRNSKPYIAVEGPDRNLWFCESGASKIGCFDPRAVEFREFDLPSPDCTPIGIDVGPDGHFMVHRENRQSRWSHRLRRYDRRVWVADPQGWTRRNYPRTRWKHVVFCGRY